MVLFEKKESILKIYPILFRTMKVNFLFTTFKSLLGLFLKIFLTPDQISLKAT